MRRSLTLAILAMLLVCNGCKTCEARKLQKETATSQPEPLSHDPTDQFKLSGWWSNGRQLMQLRDDGAYTLFRELSRYSGTIERGHWAKISYAVVRLEPYNTPEVTSTRVGITRTDGKITLHVRDLPPFTAIDQPPATTEDSLLGEWLGSGDVLTLRNNLRYTLVVHSNVHDAPATMSGHSGSWSLVDQSIHLQPDSPGVNPATFTVEVTQDKTLLRSDAEVMEHVTPQPAATRPQ